MDFLDSISSGDESVVSPVSLYYLRTFHAVATRRSFTRAAQDLALSQPAASAHIRALERAFGARLFAVRHRRTYLTAEGETLFAHTGRIFRLLREAEHAVAATGGLEGGRLALGASPTLASYLLPSVLQAFADAHPRVAIEVAVAPSMEVAAAVAADSLPLGLVEAPVTQPVLDRRVFGEDEMVLTVPPDHPWTDGVTLDRLEGQAILRREPGSGTRALVDTALERAGVSMPTAAVLGSGEMLKEAVAAGLGSAWLPRLAVERDRQAGRLAIAEVQGLTIRRPLTVVTPRGAPTAPAAAALLELLRASAPSPVHALPESAGGAAVKRSQTA